MSRLVTLCGSLAAALLFSLPTVAHAQNGNIAGTVRDASGAALPGVTVEVTSPALIEKVRSSVTDGSGRYQITALPVGTYEVKFSLQNFSSVVRPDVIVTSDATSNVTADLKVGGLKDVVRVVAESPVVDVQNARQQQVFQGADIRELPTERNVPALLSLVPGIQTSRGICSGGVGAFCTPYLPDFNAHTSIMDSQLFVGENAGLNQGRILIDGMVVNSASPNFVTGVSGGYMADVANAQEVSFTLSGALGESETGGAAINIIPRTGGNRYAGNYFTSYTSRQLFDKNNATRNNLWDNFVNPNGTVSNAGNDIVVTNPLKYDYDVNGAFGGPIIRDRFWFFVNARNQGKEQTPSPGNPFYWNRNTGIPGKNYQPDRTRGDLTYRNEYRNISARLTAQATQKNKFNIFWDEQDSCLAPCYGVVSVYTSPESWWSVVTKPNHLGQLSWTNPFTNRLLFDARLSVTMQHYDTTKHREIANPRNVPRISESGNTAGADELASRVNNTAGGFGTSLTSGSLNNAGSELRNLDSYRSNASASYVTGSHNAKIGYEGGYFIQRSDNNPNDLRMAYAYTTPGVTCATNLTCGNTSLYFPEDPNNTLARRPVPTQFTINVGPRTLDTRVWYGALYLQDQWTLNRFTLNGALRYDHAQSRYGTTCVGADGNEPYVPIQIGGAYEGQRRWCTEPSNGVNYNDITPRWGLAWDVFGNGKTSIKWNMGKYLAGATIGGLYADVNPAERTSESLPRGWQDNNGNRVPDCRYFDFAAHSDLGDTCNAITGNTANRYGRDPLALDAAGLNAALFADTYCGRHDRASDNVQEYCRLTGNNLVGGWGARNYNWQFGLGVQHELLPRLSVDVTYTKRYYGNQTSNDTLGRGCDRFLGVEVEEDCQTGYLNYTARDYDFYGLRAPVDTRLPGGGAYMVRGISTQKVLGSLPDNGEAIAYDPELNYSWNGVDANFVLRARGGLRMSAGTSTGRSNRDTCFSTLDGPSVKGRDGDDPRVGCRPIRPLQTNVRANVSYTIPWVDVLASAIFQYRPGAERSANLQYDADDVVWEANAAHRATQTCTVNNVVTQGCFYGNNASNTGTVNLLELGDLYGEGIRLWDMKFAKNIRFAGKRINVGVDVYNLFNSDAPTGYVDTYTAWRDSATGIWYQGLGPDGGRDNPATAAQEIQNWGMVDGIVNPRFLRFQVQFDF